MGDNNTNKKTKHKKKVIKKELQCGECNKGIPKSKFKIPCAGNCGKYFHELCTKLEKDDLRQLKDGNLDWYCTRCQDCETVEESSTGADSDSEDDEKSDDENEGRILLDKASVKKKRKRNTTLEDLAEKLDLIWRTISNQTQEVTEIKKEVEELKKQNIEFKKQLETLKAEKSDEKQKLLKNNIILSGFEKKIETNEEMRTLALKTVQLVKKDINRDDIECSKVGYKEKAKIRITFRNYEDKKIVMAEKRKTTLSTKKLGLQEDNVLYINHELTRENQYLFKEAREFRKQFNYKFVWANEEKVYLRKTETSKILSINKESQLNDLKTQETKKKPIKSTEKKN